MGRWISDLVFLNLQEDDVVKIQAFWRAKKAKKDYTQLGEFLISSFDCHVII